MNVLLYHHSWVKPLQLLMKNIINTEAKKTKEEAGEFGSGIGKNIKTLLALQC